MNAILLGLLLLLLTCSSFCFRGGPPINTPERRDAVCNQLWPAGHSSIDAQQEGDGGFVVSTNLTLTRDGNAFNYVGGQFYQIVLSGTGRTFLGFLIQARSRFDNQLPIGRFMVGDPNLHQLLNCSENDQVSATVAHRNPDRFQFSSVSVIWQAPQDRNGEVRIRFTVVVTFLTYYIDRNAAQVLVAQPTQPPPDPTPLSLNVTPPSLDVNDYRLTFATPSGCMPSNCTVFVGIATNRGDPTYLDFYITAQTESWGAVGFSETRSMFDSDVLGCYINTTSGMVEVVDTWNVRDRRRNTLDDIQDTVQFSGTNIDGRITCTFVRSIAGSPLDREDRNLNNSLYILYGVGVRVVDPIFLVHNLVQVPTVSLQRFNPVLDSDDDRVVETPRAPEDYRLIFRTPAGCNVTDCTVFVGIDNNNRSDAFLDFYMTGRVQAWVAIGFSNTRSMFAADVLACNLNPVTGMAEVLDTYNDDIARLNFRDTSQDVVVFNTSVSDERITCVFARSVAGNAPFNIVDDTVEDVNLNASYWVMYGYRPADPVAGALRIHDTAIPALSPILVNPTTDNITELPPVILPEGVVDAQLAPEQYRLILQDPEGCSPSQCNIFVGISTNPGNSSFLDFYIEGEAQGWVAVGFSDSQNMFDADVIGCSLNPDTGVVEALDTWNPSSPTRGNIADAVQDVFLFFGTAENGRISCSFTRLTTGSDLADPVQDLDLNNDYYAMYGVRPTTSGAGSFMPHVLGVGGNPVLSGQRVNPAVDGGAVAGDVTRQRLVRAHGILMLIAWPLMAVLAIFFAAWMRPALPNGEWFQIHRFLMTGSIVVGVVGFVLIFIANRNNSPPGLINLGSDNPIGTTHYVFGIIVMFLHLLNPLISICRCKPDDNKRWIFNIIHGTFIGLFAEILALTNVGLGLALFSQSLSIFRDLTVLYVYLGYIGFFFAMIFALFVLYTIIAYTSSDENRKGLAPSLVKPLVTPSSSSSEAPKVNMGVELTVPGTTSTNSDPTPTKPKVPSRDAPIRWLALMVFATVVILFVVVLVILVAID